MSLLTGPQTSTTSVSTPDYLRPYYDRALSRGETAFAEQYKPYTGQLTAGLAPTEAQGVNSAANLQIPGQFQSAGNVLNAAGTGIMGIAGFQPGNLTGGFNPTQFNSGYTAQQTTGGIFDSGAAQQYMNPFQQNVTDIALREADRDFQKQQSQLRARAGAAGAFGGSRATLLETENQRNQNELRNDIQTRGAQSAFSNAQEQFERDRAARLSAFGQNEEARRAQATLGLDAQRLGDTSRQFADRSAIDRFQAQEGARNNAAQIALRGYEGAANIGQGLGQLGTQVGSEARANINTQLGAGLQQREQQQLNLNNQYQQFLEERGYPREQAMKFAELLGGLGRGQTVTQNTGSAPGDLNQILGLLAQGTGILGAVGGEGGASAGLNKVLGGIGSLFGGNTASPPTASSLPATSGTFTGGYDDSDFNPFGGGFDVGNFLSGVGSSVSEGFSGLFNQLFPN